MNSPRIVPGCAWSLAALVLALLVPAGPARAQGYDTDPEDYYIDAYYGLLSEDPPPEEIRDDVSGSTMVQGGANRVFRRFRRIRRVSRMGGGFRGPRFRPRVGAGAIFDDVALSLDYSYASVDDRLLRGDGEDYDYGAVLSGSLGSALMLGLGLTHATYDIDGTYDYLQNTDTVDFYLTWAFSDTFAAGLYMNCNWIDIENSYWLNAQTGQFEDIGDSYERWGGGLMASGNMELTQSTNVGLLTTVLSANKSSPYEWLDNEDSVWLTMLDISQQLTDTLGAGVYGNYSYMLDPDTGDPDSRYWIWGAELIWDVSRDLGLTLGYETTAADDDREEHRGSVGLMYAF